MDANSKPQITAKKENCQEVGKKHFSDGRNGIQRHSTNISTETDFQANFHKYEKAEHTTL